MTTLLALDPGGHTGWSSWTYGPTTPLTLLEHGQIADGLAGFVRWSRAYLEEVVPDELVSESFVLDGRTASPDVTPLRIEGAIEALFAAEGVPIIFQRNVMKSGITDDRLRASGLWIKGQQHARDSIRHAIVSMKVRKHVPTINRFWPRNHLRTV